MDRYDFSCVVDTILKESKSIEDMVSRYSQMLKDMESLFRDNVALRVFESEGADDETDT